MIKKEGRKEARKQGGREGIIKEKEKRQTGRERGREGKREEGAGKERLVFKIFQQKEYSSWFSGWKEQAHTLWSSLVTLPCPGPVLTSPLNPHEHIH